MHDHLRLIPGRMVTKHDFNKFSPDFGHGLSRTQLCEKNKSKLFLIFIQPSGGKGFEPTSDEYNE